MEHEAEQKEALDKLKTLVSELIVTVQERRDLRAVSQKPEDLSVPADR